MAPEPGQRVNLPNGDHVNVYREGSGKPVVLIHGRPGTGRMMLPLARANLENISDYAKPDEVTEARRLVREIIGEIEVKETTDGVFAYTKLNTVSGYKAGAQKRT